MHRFEIMLAQFLALSLTQLSGMVYCVNAANNAFIKDTSKDGLKCQVDYRVIDNSSECARFCALHSECLGFFYNPVKGSCVGCRNGYLPHLTEWVGSIYYKNGVPHYGAPCLIAADCPFPHTKCNDMMICECVEGHRREPNNIVCVKFCENYDTTYILHSRTRFEGTPPYIEYGISAAQCKDNCSNSPDCLGFNYFHDNEACGNLYHTDYNSTFSFIVFDPFDHYTKNCKP